MAYHKHAISVLLLCSITYTATALNIYISKEHLSEYYQNSDIATKVEVVHNRRARVSSSGHLTFNNGTDLLPFPNRVNVVTFTWLTGREEVTYGIELQEDFQLMEQSGLLIAPSISISDTGVVPENRSTFDVNLQCTLEASGIARINVNLSLHYMDGFSVGEMFFLEKHCTVDSSISTDIIQPTKTIQNLMSTDDSAEGSGKESILDTATVMSPVSPVITTSTRQNSSTSHAVTFTSLPLMGSSVSTNYSSVTTSVTVSSTTAESLPLVTSSSSKALSASPQQSTEPATTIPSSVVNSMRGHSSGVVSSLPQSAVPVLNSVLAVSTSSSSNLAISHATTVMPSIVATHPSSTVALNITVSSPEMNLTSSPESSQTRSPDVITTAVATPQSVPTVIESTSVTTQLNTSSIGSPILSSMSVLTSSTAKLTPTSMQLSNTSSLLYSSVAVLSSHSISVSTTSNVSESSSHFITSSGVPVLSASSSVNSSVLLPVMTSSIIASSSVVMSTSSTTAVSSSTISVIAGPTTTGTVGSTSVENTMTDNVSSIVTSVLSNSKAIGSTSSSVNLIPTIVASEGDQITSTSSPMQSSVHSSSSALQMTTSKTTSSVVSTTESVSASASRGSSFEIPTKIVPSTASLGTPLTTSSVISSDILEITNVSISSISTNTLISISSSETVSPTPVPDTSAETLGVLAVTSSMMSSSEVLQSAVVSVSTSTVSSEIVSTSIKSVTSSDTSNIFSSMPVSSSAASHTTSVSVTSSSIITPIGVISSNKTISVSSAIRFSALSVTSSGYSTSSSAITGFSTEIVSVTSSATIPIVVPPATTSKSISKHSLSTTPGTSSYSTVQATDDSETDEASLTLIIVVAATTSALITICIMLICIIFALTFRRRRKSKKRCKAQNPIHIEFKSETGSEVKSKEEEYVGPPSVWTNLRWGSIRNLSRPAQKLVQLTVERESIEMLDTIKKGEYGWLIKARAALEKNDNSSPVHRLVLIKMITGLGLGSKACGSCEEVSEFLGNATLLRSIHHPNLLPVLGLNSDDHKAPIVIYPFPDIGNLHTFLTSHKGDGSDAKLKEPLTPKMLMDFCVQLSEALKHLECLHIVHPDLQLRTCQLDADFTVRLGDGALMSDFYPECYHVVYGAQRPVRWSALETLQGGLCTLPSNVWSFGITLWEIVTLGEFPYSEVTNRNVLAHVMLGSRLEQPHDCPNEMYELMCSCWNTSPRQRPMFADITNQLKNLARLYSSDDDIGIPTSDSAFFIKQREWPQFPPQSFHYNDQNMSHPLTTQTSASDAVSITFSALGSTEDLTQTGISASSIDDSRHHNVMSPMAIPTETSSSVHSPVESLPPTPLCPTPHVNIVPSTTLDDHPMIPSRVPLRNEPVTKFLSKTDGSRESTPDNRFSMSSDSQHSSSQFSTDTSESSRQHLLRNKRDSPEKRPAQAAIAEQRYGDEELSRKTSDPVPAMEGDMLSELMASFEEQMTHSSNQ